MILLTSLFTLSMSFILDRSGSLLGSITSMIGWNQTWFAWFLGYGKSALDYILKWKSQTSFWDSAEKCRLGGSASLQLKLKRKTPELSWFSGPELFPVKTINGITIKQYESGNRPRCQINNLRPSGCIQKAIYAPPEFRGRCYLYFFFCPRHASINNQKDAIHSQWSHCWNFEILKDFWWNRFLTGCGLKVDRREDALGSVSGSANVFHNRGGIGKQLPSSVLMFIVYGQLG